MAESILNTPEVLDALRAQYEKARLSAKEYLETHAFVSDVRCPTQGCNRKLAEGLEGTLFIWCRSCGKIVKIVR